VLGLAVFYQYVRTAALNQQQTKHVSVFTTELFAHFLNERCLAATQTSSSDEVLRLINYISDTQMFTADVLASKSEARTSAVNSKSVFHSFHYQPITVHSSSPQTTVMPTDLNTSKLVELLQQSAVEHLTKFRQLEAQDFGSVATVVTTDFEALYAYKHGDYQRCLQLSTDNVRTLLNPVPLLSGLPIYPESLQLLDDDIVSLTALTLIVNPECRDQCINVVMCSVTLSLYLLTQCQMKLRHSLTSLSQTLDYIESVQTMHKQATQSLDKLVLELAKRKVLMYSE